MHDPILFCFSSICMYVFLLLTKPFLSEELFIVIIWYLVQLMASLRYIFKNMDQNLYFPFQLVGRWSYGKHLKLFKNYLSRVFKKL